MSLVPGFVDRPADPQADLDAVSAILEASERRLYGGADSPRSFLEYAWRTSWIDVPTMTRVVFAGDRPIAYAEVEAVDPTVSVHGWVCVHPDHLGRGLGSVLADWAERTAVATAPAGASVLFHHTIPAADRDATEIVQRRGLRHVNTSWHMRMPLDGTHDAGSVPSGVTIRPSRAGEDDVAIHDTLMRAFEGSFAWSFVPFERFWRDARADPNFGHDWVLVAELGDDVVGVSWQWKQESVGWVGELGVRPEMQGRGIGRALLRHALADLARRGFRTAQLNVDSHNEFGAVDLYESVGMQIHREYRSFEKPIVGAGMLPAPDG